MPETGPTFRARGTFADLVLLTRSSAPQDRTRAFKPSDLWQRALPTALLGLALVGVPVLIFQPEGLPRMRTLSTELAGLQDENDGLRREIGVLRTEVARLRDDPTSVERIARDQLGLVKKNEVVLQFGTADRGLRPQGSTAPVSPVSPAAPNAAIAAPSSH